jgi:leader peptidase (prepilin peptidase) / N-methyltransferase
MLIIFFTLGLIIGSFLNVLVYRFNTAEELIFDRSRCPHCKKIIHWYDNVPVLSFILLQARCRDCKNKISWQYPLVEIFTGFIFAALGFHFFNLNNPETWITTFYYLAIAGSLIIILVYDWLYLEILSSVLWVSVALAIAFSLYVDWGSGAESGILGGPLLLESRVYSGVLAAYLAFLFFFSLSFFSKEKWMGMGDAYLAILIGLVLGWPEIILAIFLSFLIGAVYGIIMMILKKKRMKSQIPFAPFLALGAFIALIFYPPIMNWYFSLLVY